MDCEIFVESARKWILQCKTSCSALCEVQTFPSFQLSAGAKSCRGGVCWNGILGPTVENPEKSWGEVLNKSFGTKIGFCCCQFEGEKSWLQPRGKGIWIVTDQEKRALRLLDLNSTLTACQNGILSPLSCA